MLSLSVNDLLNAEIVNKYVQELGLFFLRARSSNLPFPIGSGARSTPHPHPCNHSTVLHCYCPFSRPFSRWTWVSRYLLKLMMMGGGGDNWTTGAISRAKLHSNHHHQQINIQFFCRPDALPLAQPTVSKHWCGPPCTVPCIVYSFTVVSGPPCMHITFAWFVYPKLTWGLPTLSVTTNSSWLPLWRVAMPVISPLIPLYCQTVWV